MRAVNNFPLDKSAFMDYITSMLNEVKILLNNEIKVTSPRSQFVGLTGRVRKILSDDRTLEVELDKPTLRHFCGGKVIFIDFTLVSEIHEPPAHAQGEPNLGPDANSLLPKNRI